MRSPALLVATLLIAPSCAPTPVTISGPNQRDTALPIPWDCPNGKQDEGTPIFDPDAPGEPPHTCVLFEPITDVCSDPLNWKALGAPCPRLADWVARAPHEPLYQCERAEAPGGTVWTLYAGPATHHAELRRRLVFDEHGTMLSVVFSTQHYPPMTCCGGAWIDGAQVWGEYVPTTGCMLATLPD